MKYLPVALFLGALAAVLFVAIFVVSPGGMRPLDDGFSCASAAAERATNPPKIGISCSAYPPDQVP